ncbi:MAG: hypothetical protein ABSE36_11835 [Terracidiphilus sp.]|jgi:hypothetical protein
MLKRADLGPLVERELLIQRICDWTREHDRRFRPDGEFRLRLSLRTQSLEALRRFFEEDCTAERAAELARIETPRRAVFLPV